MNATVYLVDDDAAVRAGLTEVLAGEGFVVRAFESAEAFLDAVDPLAPGCIVLDVRMPGMDGLQAQAALTRRGIDLPVIILTGHADVPMSVRAMKAGCFDFLEKPVAADTLIARALGAVRLSESRHQERAALEAARRRIARLTPREIELIEPLLAGLHSKQIAKQAGISPRTVEVHRRNILQKTQTGGLLELAELYRTANASRKPESPR